MNRHLCAVPAQVHRRTENQADAEQCVGTSRARCRAGPHLLPQPNSTTRGRAEKDLKLLPCRPRVCHRGSGCFFYLLCASFTGEPEHHQGFHKEAAYPHAAAHEAARPMAGPG